MAFDRVFVALRRRTALLAGIAAAALAPTAAFAQAAVPTPTVSVAPTVGELWAQSSFDERRDGLVEEEFFFEGTTSAGVPFKSRMIVRRPVSAAKFNGTVIVEWMNASSGSDLDVDYPTLRPLILHQGYAYVAVTVQANTIDFLRKRNPARYGTLHLTDDQAQNAAFEVFSQAGQALRGKVPGVDPLHGLKAKVLIATGQSQSSSRLTIFVNKVHGLTLAPVYDAVLLHSGGAAPTRFPLPVLKLNSENETAGYFTQRKAADPNYRYWEVPGTSHQPLEGTQQSLHLLDLARPPGFPRCPFPYSGPGGPVPIDPVERAGIFYLDRMVRTHQSYPNGPLIDQTAAADGKTGVVQRDKYGNATGGIRMPQQEVPTGRNTPSTGCKATIQGQTVVLGTYPQWDAFDGGKDPVVDPADMVNATEPASAKAVYGTHANYVARFDKAVDAILAQGFILKFDADAMKKAAADSDIAK